MSGITHWFVGLVLVCSFVASAAAANNGGPREVEGVKVLTAQYLQAQGSCSGFVWMQCATGYGIPANSTKYPQCCGDWKYYCPSGFQECTAFEGCCQNGFPYYCSSDAGAYCCPADFPICSNGKCLKGGCACSGCTPDPCAFMDCASCEACCNYYIPNICNGWSCTGGQVGSANNYTTTSCKV